MFILFRIFEIFLVPLGKPPGGERRKIYGIYGCIFWHCDGCYPAPDHSMVLVTNTPEYEVAN